jgi:bifunctional non-homologous end joining protein LigD
MINPMLCRLEAEPFNKQDFIWEPKLDGTRIIAVIRDGKARLFSRSGREKTTMFPDLKIITKRDCTLDGEVECGTSFNDLQHRVNRENNVAQTAKEFPVRYSIFDTLELVGVTITGFPLLKRKEILKTIVVPTESVTLTPYVTDGIKLFNDIKADGGEGVVGKNTLGYYAEGKRDWIKVKTWREAIFKAVGYTPGTGWRESTFGALVLSDLKGNHIGSVGYSKSVLIHEDFSW